MRKSIIAILIMLYICSLLVARAEINSEIRFADVEWNLSTLDFQEGIIEVLGIDKQEFEFNTITGDRIVALDTKTWGKETVLLTDDFHTYICLIERSLSNVEVLFEGQPITGIVIRTMPITTDNKCAIGNHSVICSVEVALDCHGDSTVFQNLVQKYEDQYGKPDFSSSSSSVWLGTNNTYVQIDCSKNGNSTLYYGFSDAISLSKELMNHENDDDNAIYLVNYENYKIKYENCSVSRMWSLPNDCVLDIYVTVLNDFEKPLKLKTNGVYINGWKIDDFLLGEYVAAGKKQKETLEFFNVYSDAEIASVEEINEIELTFEIICDNTVIKTTTSKLTFKK